MSPSAQQRTRAGLLGFLIGKERRGILSARIAVLAFMLWLASLACPVFVFEGSQTAFGLSILTNGWIGPLALNFAWYANVLFMMAFWRLTQSGKDADGRAWAAVIVSMNTFTFTRILTDEGGGHASLYGYGIGVPLWLLALLTIAFAGQLQRLEEEEQNSIGSIGLNRSTILSLSLPVILAAVLVSVFANYTIHDRTRAGDSEREKLRTALFKRGQLCEINDVKSQAVLRLTGPLEVVEAYDEGKSPVKFVEPETLLNWGIPTVRKNGVDYFYTYPGYSRRISARAAQGPSSARLDISSIHGSSVVVEVDATLSQGKTRAFSGRWRRLDSQRNRFCPSFDVSGFGRGAPRLLMQNSLRRADGSALLEPGERNTPYPPLKPISVTKGPVLDPATLDRNTGCPENYGIVKDAKQLDDFVLKGAVPVVGSYGLIRTGGELHQGPAPDTEMRCTGKFVYLISRSGGNTESHRFQIERYSLDHFRVARPRGYSVAFDHDLRGEPGEFRMQLVRVFEEEDRTVVLFAYESRKAPIATLVTVRMRIPEA